MAKQRPHNTVERQIWITIYGSRQVHATGDRIEVVRVLDRQQTFPFGARRPRTLHHSHTAAKRDRYAPHGPHAQQHASGCVDAPRPPEGQERLLGSGYRPRLDRNRGEGCGQTQGRGYRQGEPHARGVPAPRVGVEGEARRHHPQAAAQAGSLVRLGPYMLHDGRDPHAERHQGLRRPLQQRQDIPRRAYGTLGPRSQDGPLGRGGDIQGVAGQTLLPALQDRGHGPLHRRGHDSSRDHSGRYGRLPQPR